MVTKKASTGSNITPNNFFCPIFSRSTPRQRRDEDCFDVDLDNIHGKEFDFERNLALFDKKCVLEEIESNQPDVVRLIDHNRRGGTKTKTTTVSFTSFFKKTSNQPFTISKLLKVY